MMLEGNTLGVVLGLVLIVAVAIVGVISAFVVGHGRGLAAGLTAADKVIEQANGNATLIKLAQVAGESVPPEMVNKLLSILSTAQALVPTPEAKALVNDVSQFAQEATGRVALPADVTVTTTTVTPAPQPSAPAVTLQGSVNGTPNPFNVAALNAING